MNLQDKSEQEFVNKKILRQRQELVESKREMARALYKYQGLSIISAGSALLTGDFLVAASTGNMVSPRGVLIQMSAAQLANEINSGSLSRVFDPDDLNSKDFESVMDTILDKMNLQSQYADASHYFLNDTTQEGVAVFMSPIVQTQMMCVIEKRFEAGVASYALKTGVGYAIDNMREVSYAEFNPGGLDLQTELVKINPEVQNKSTAYEKMRDEYESNGYNQVKEPGQVLNQKNMSATERLRQYSQVRDAYDQNYNQNDPNNKKMNEPGPSDEEIAIDEAIDMGYIPRSMRRYI